MTPSVPLPRARDGTTGPDGSGQSGDGRPPVLLSRPLGSSTWLGSRGGDPITARVAAPARDGQLADQLPPVAAFNGAGTDHSRVVPLLGADRVDGTTWLLSPYVDGLCLERLLNVATLTPIQAAYIATEMFAGLAELHSAGARHGRLTASKVLIGVDGVPRLSDWAPAALGAAPAAGRLHEADLRAARVLVRRLARNADRPVAWHHRRAAVLLNGLQRFAVTDSTADATAAAHELRAMLTVALGTEATTAQPAAELAALVTSWRAHTSPDRQAALRAGRLRRLGSLVRQRLGGAALQQLPDRPTAAEPRGGWPRPGRRRWLWATAVVVLALLVLGGYLLVRPDSSLLNTVLHRNSSSAPSGAPASGRPAAPARQQPGAAAAKSPRAVASLAPAAAGLVAGVSVHATSTCRPHASCVLRMRVRLVPTAATQHVSWQLILVDRCSGARTRLHDGTVTVRPGGTEAALSRRVALPAGRAFGLIAMTTAPAKAASSPLLVPATASRC